MKFFVHLLTIGCVICLGSGGLVAQSPDGKSIPIALKSKAISESPQDLPGGAVRRIGSTRFRTSEAIKSHAFSNDGKTVALCCEDGFIRLFEAETGKEFRRTQFDRVFEESRIAISLSAGRLVAIHNHHVQVCDFDGRGLKVIRIPEKYHIIDSLQISDDGRFAVVGCPGEEGGVVVLNLEKGECAHELKFDQDWAHRAIISPKGNLTATFGETSSIGGLGRPMDRGNYVQIWDIATGRRKLRIQSEIQAPECVRFSPDGTKLAIGGRSFVEVWDVNGKILRRFAGRSGIGRLLTFSRDSDRVAAGSEVGAIQIWRISDGKRIANTEPFLPGCCELRYTADDRLLCLQLDRFGFAIWEPLRGKRHDSPAGHSGWIRSLHFAPEQDTLFSIDGSGRTFRWSFGTGADRPEAFRPGITEVRHSVTEMPADGEYVHLSPNGRKLLKYDPTRGGMGIFETAGGRRPVILESDHQRTVRPESTQFSADSLHLLSVNHLFNGSQIFFPVWNVESGRASRPFKFCSQGHTTAETLSPDGRTAACAIRLNSECTNKTLGEILTWDVETAVPLNIPLPTTAYVYAMRFINNRQYAATDRDGGIAITIIDAVTNHEVRKLQQSKLAEGLNDVSILAVSLDQRFLVATYDLITASNDERPGLDFTRPLIVWETATGTIRHQFSIPDADITTAIFSADGRHLFVGLSDSTILQWDLGKPAEKVPPLDAAALAHHWEKLADPSAAAAERSARILTERSAESVPFFAATLKPADIVKVDAERVRKLITELDDDNFAVREAASKELVAIGRPAVEPAKIALAKTQSAEVRERLERFLVHVRVPSAEIPPHLIRPLRAIQILEWTGNDAAIAVLKNLAKGGDSPQTQAAADSLKRLEAKKRK